MNDLVKATETKRNIISKIRSRIRMPVLGEIISDYGEGKDLQKLKNGLVVSTHMSNMAFEKYINKLKKLSINFILFCFICFEASEGSTPITLLKFFG